MAGDIIAVDAISCWAECLPATVRPPLPISPASRGTGDSAGPDRWLSPVKDVGLYWTRNNYLDFSVRSNSGTGSQHIMGGRDNTLPRSFSTCHEGVVKLKPPEGSVWFLVSSSRLSTCPFATPTTILEGRLLASAASCHISSPCQRGLPRLQDKVGASRTSQAHLPNGSLEFLIRTSSMAIIEDVVLYLHDDHNDTGNAVGVRPGPPKNLPPSPAHTTWTGTGASLIPRITAAGGPSLSLQGISVCRLID